MSLAVREESILQNLISLASAGQLHGCYSDIPESVYNDPRCPGLRSGDIKEIVSKSYSLWQSAPKKDSSAFEFGRDFHAVMEGVVETIDPMMKAMRAKILSHPEARDLVLGSQMERTYFSVDQETGLLKRCRADLYTQQGIVADYKTTKSAATDSFIRDARKYLYRISAAFYLEIISEVMGQVHRDFRLIAVEKALPFEVAVFKIDERSISKGEEEVRMALRLIRNVREHNAWSGYPLGQEIQI